MYILDRIISRSSRSLAAMIGFSWVLSDNACGGRSGSPDDDAAITRGWHVLALLSVFLPYPELVAAPRISRGAMSS
jgi:hypothetical protein